MKRITMYLIFFSLMIILFTGCSDKKQFLTLTTGGTGGTYYPVGGAIAQTVTENIDYLTVNSLIGNASVANCNLIGEGETDSALVQNNVAFWAYKGIGAFEGNPIENLRGIASLYPEAIQVIALADSNIKTIEDLKNKKVGVGELGSGVHFDVTNILEAYDMTEADFNPMYLSFSEASDMLKEKKIDAAFITAGYPTSSITDINITTDIIIVPILEEKIMKMIEVSPYYTETIIPAGTYNGIDIDIPTVTTMAMWVISSDVDDDIVYDMTKALWENRDEVESAHEKGNNITIESALNGMGIPLHSGAEKYYKEIGMY